MQQHFVDVISVTFNSSKWIDGYIQSILVSDFPLKRINLIIIDNHSTDDTVQKLEAVRAILQKRLGSFLLIKSQKNHGFGIANNIGAREAKSNLLLFLNIDTEIDKQAFKILQTEVTNTTGNIGAWELRQLPFEHPKYYHPVTGYTTWASGAALLIHRIVFEKVKGFDPIFFMYAEDVDISWKIRMHGYFIKYIPLCTLHHYSYQVYNETKPLQYIYSIINNLILRLKFGGFRELKKGLYLMRMVLWHKGPFEDSRKIVLKQLSRELYKFPRAWLWHVRNKKLIRENKPHQFFGFDYEQQREGAMYYVEKPTSNPKVSFIVRTVNRPLVLRETLISLRNQTYKNIEVVIVEDGPNRSETYIKEHFKDLNIKYYATDQKKGRTKAGNIGFALSSGTYLNILDDDDLLFADHTETLVRFFERLPQFKIMHNWAWEAKTKTLGTNPYLFEFVTKQLVYKRRFNRLRLCMHNFLPIQTVMFKREVYENLGGFDETMDTLEDWDLWLRYSLKYDYYTVEKTCSIYKVPFDLSESHQRILKFNSDYAKVREAQKKYLIVEDPISLALQFKNIDQ
jgi:GT2 family glycosyltransferase